MKKFVLFFFLFISVWRGQSSHAFSIDRKPLSSLTKDLKLTHERDDILKERDKYYIKDEGEFDGHLELHISLCGSLISFAKAVRVVFPNIKGFKSIKLKANGVSFRKIKPIWSKENLMKNRPLAFELMETIFGKWGSEETPYSGRLKIDIIDKYDSNREQYKQPLMFIRGTPVSFTTFFMIMTPPNEMRNYDPDPIITSATGEISRNLFTFSVFIDSNTERQLSGRFKDKKIFLSTELRYLTGLVHELIHVAGYLNDKRGESRSGEELRTKIEENKILIELFRARNIRPLFVIKDLLDVSADDFYCSEDESTKCASSELSKLKREIRSLEKTVSDDYDFEQLMTDLVRSDDSSIIQKREVRARSALEAFAQEILDDALSIINLP